MGYFARHRIFGCFTKQLLLTGGLLMLSSANYGFDNQGFGSTQAMKPFTRQFGVRKGTGYALETYFLSLLNSLVFIGFGLGAYIGSVISAKYGRRMTIFSMSLWALVTAVLLVTSKTRTQILIARILNYIYVGMELSTVPIYQAEIMPAPIRGFAVATYQFSLLAGGIIINSICRGTSTLPNNRAWQIPYALYTVIPSIVGSLIWFCPESPRWCLLNGREEQARNALIKYQGSKPGFDVDLEIKLLQQAIEEEQLQGSYKELFQGVNRKRTFIALGTNFFLQSTGQAFASSYGAVFIASLGTINPFNMTITNSCCNTIANGFSMYFTDKLGRRKIMITGVFLQCVFVFIMGCLGLQTPVTAERKTAIVAMLTLFGASFSFGWAPNNYVVTSEVPALRLRDKTQRLAAITNIATNFVVAFTLPYLLNAPYADLQSKVGFIYAAFAAMACVFGFLCIPECKGKSLEEIDALFMNGTPIRKFGSTMAPVGSASAELSRLEHHTKDDGAQMEIREDEDSKV